MKRKILTAFLLLSIFIGNVSYAGPRKGGSKRAGSRRNATTVKIEAKTSTTPAETNNTEPELDFAGCMDNICKSNYDDDKGRCRCSSQLIRIEKILRDIDKIQNEADAQNKNLEALMNVNNTALVSDSVGNVYNNINSIEKKAKNLASKRIDSKTLVAEGLPLYKHAYSECKASLPSNKSDAAKREQEYQTKIEEDCSAYTSILKEKADTAQNLLVQAQKNQEMYEEQQHKALNQLDVSSCYIEYENCMKSGCGEDFTFCRETAKFESNLKKCESINYGKCEDNKVVVMNKLRKLKTSMIAKDDIKLACQSSNGQIIGGKCLYTVRYVADNGDSDEKTFLPGQTVTCDDNRGDFKELQLGCKESCYLMGRNGEQIKIGTNKETNGNKNAQKVVGAIFTLGLSQTNSNLMVGCKSDNDLDRYTLPVPKGWGRDGFPEDEELKNAF